MSTKRVMKPTSIRRAPLRRAGDFTYRHDERRRWKLYKMCLEEWQHGHDSIASLYASLLAGRLAALEPAIDVAGRRLVERLGIEVDAVEDNRA